MNKKQPKNSVAKKLHRSTNTFKETEEVENNEILNLLKNSEEVSNNGQNIISNKNSDKVEEKLPSVSRKRKRSDAGHIKTAFDDRNHINSKLDPGHRLDIKKRWKSLVEKTYHLKNEINLLPVYLSSFVEIIIASELEGRLLEASKNMYAKYIVCKLMKFCPEYGSKILTEFKGQVKKLFLHTEARIVLLEAIQYIINKQESFNYIIMLRILLEYFIYADEPKLKKVIEIICEHIPLLLHTWEGSQVAMLCFPYGTVKECKVMLKSMKEYIAKICKEEYGYLVLLRAFDVVDDTVSVTKYIIDQMVKPSVFETIMHDKFGHRMVLYLLTGRERSKMYLGFDTFQLLEKGDEIRAKTSKKDPAIRTNELRKTISPALINYTKENTAEMLSNTYMTQIFCETLLCGETAIEEKISILENIPALIGDTSNENNIMLSC
ncbi:ARM repeat-containing protein [Gigaspora margarita]|uniref:ARM repeat-containing protein n=1 Tax=Gigaspora margarita TaxID=4874 RepID=A0A8H4A2Y7_GIGMA|nr:ARM repeat-containing protein [Gigaspora margarita]